MGDYAFENLFCCPLCKSPLRIINEQFFCESCKEKFSKEGNVYNFRIERDSWERDKESKFENILSKNNKSEWFRDVMKYVSKDKYLEYITDGHITEIENYINNLVRTGINVGKRYDSVYVPQNNIDPHMTDAVQFSKLKDYSGIALDIGSGTLRVARDLVKLGFDKVIAIDLLPEIMLYGYKKLSEEEKKKIVLVQADVRFLPIREGAVNFAVALELFEHIDAPLLFLLDLKRTMHTSGIAVLNTWNSAELRNQNVIKEKGVSYYENGFYYKFYNEDDLKKVLNDSGTDFAIKHSSFYFERRILNLLGSNFVSPFLLMEEMIGKLFPKYLFHHLYFKIKK